VTYEGGLLGGCVAVSCMMAGSPFGDTVLSGCSCVPGTVGNIVPAANVMGFINSCSVVNCTDEGLSDILSYSRPLLTADFNPFSGQFVSLFDVEPASVDHTQFLPSGCGCPAGQSGWVTAATTSAGIGRIEQRASSSFLSSALVQVVVATAEAGTSYVATCRSAAAGAAQGILTFKLDMTNLSGFFEALRMVSSETQAQVLNYRGLLDDFLHSPFSSIYGKAVLFYEFVSGIDENNRTDVNVYFANLATAQDALAALPKVKAFMDIMMGQSAPMIILGSATANEAPRLVAPVVVCGQTFLGFYSGGLLGRGCSCPPGHKQNGPICAAVLCDDVPNASPAFLGSLTVPFNTFAQFFTDTLTLGGQNGTDNFPFDQGNPSGCLCADGYSGWISTAGSAIAQNYMSDMGPFLQAPAVPAFETGTSYAADGFRNFCRELPSPAQKPTTLDFSVRLPNDCTSEPKFSLDAVTKATRLMADTFSVPVSAVTLQPDLTTGSPWLGEGTCIPAGYILINVRYSFPQYLTANDAKDVLPTINAIGLLGLQLVESSVVVTRASCTAPSQAGYVFADGTLTHSTTRTSTCAAGWKLQGVATATPITCTDGNWNLATGCTNTAPCTAPSQMGFVFGGSGLTNGSTRTVSCAAGYTASSGSLSPITCSNGEWSMAAGCIAPTTRAPGLSGASSAALSLATLLSVAFFSLL